MEKIRTPGDVRKLAAMAGALALASGAPPAHGAPVLPSGASIASGSVSITAPNSTSRLIVQSSNKAVINWQDFSVSNGASVTFRQPDSTSIILNRVVGPDASSIRGNLTANGQVWLINSNGILFGSGSTINVGGLIATTSDIGNSDFLSGNYSFGGASTNPDADVVNRGTISTATGGSVVLSAARVANRGMIQANLGYVVLGGASTFSIDFDGDKLLSYAVTAPVPEAPKNGSGNPRAALVVSPGTIVADGGKVLMTARAADTVVDDVINANGIILARSVSVQNGEVVLDAGEGGAITVSGTLDASGRNPGETGGTIAVHGAQVTVADGANLDASGDTGGGKISVGANLAAQGSENSQAVTVGRAVIAADALGNGTGGTITIAATGQTTVAASLSARGGAGGGDGGTVQTSGNVLQIQDGVQVDTSAAMGATGKWLLEAQDLDVDAAFAGSVASSLPTTNVSATAQNDLTIDAPMIYGSANSLTFLAGHDLTFNATVQNGGPGTIFAAAGGDVTLAPLAAIRTGGTGDALVIAANGNFNNQAGDNALDVSGGGRWLVFLNTPANNNAGGLSASPFYNRAFNFLTDGYAAVAATGNRFVYALAPVLTVTVDNKTKVYGSANPALTATITGGLPGDAAAGLFTGAPSLGTTATTNSNVGDYAITGTLGTLASDFNYGFQIVSGTLHIDPATLMASLTGTVEKVYDGTTSAILTAANYHLTGIVSDDSVALNNPVSGIYDNRNAGSGKTVSVNGLALSGADKDNYVLASSNVSGTVGVIDAATLTALLSGTAEKTYDGTTAATLTAANYRLTGMVSNDSVALNNPASGVYDNKNAGSGKTVSVSGLALSGADKDNYVLASSNVSGTVGVIDAATLTASLSGTVEKTYDGTTSATLASANYHLAGVISNDSVALNNSTSGLYDNKNVGTGKTVSVSGLALSGADKDNYVLASSNVSGTVGVIDAATLTASLAGTVEKTYDGTTAATLAAANYHLAGVISGDSVALNNPASGVYDNKNAGTGKTVSASGLALSGADKSNYVLASSNVSGTVGVIDAATLTASLAGTVEKTYNGTTAATLAAANFHLTGTISNDSVALNSPASGLYDNKNAGSGKSVSVSGLALSGADKANYVLASSNISGTIGVIDTATVTASLTGTVQKVYDGTTSAALAAGNYSLAGAISGDSVTVSGPASGLYDTKDVGTGKIVSASGLALSGADKGNYVLASSNVSGAVGVIVLPESELVTNLLGNTYTSAPVSPIQNPPPASPPVVPPTGPTGTGVQDVSDATSDITGATGDDSGGANTVATKVGQSLSGAPGAAQSASFVVIEGLLRQFSPPPGGGTPRGVPPVGQVYSSWGNEAFWQ